MSQTTPRPPGERGGGLRWNAWNLLLLVPLLMLVTPWFNAATPTLFGMPYFYWVQFVWVPVGVVCVAVVYVMTRDRAPGPDAPGGVTDITDVDGLDEGSPR